MAGPTRREFAASNRQHRSSTSRVRDPRPDERIEVSVYVKPHAAASATASPPGERRESREDMHTRRAAEHAEDFARIAEFAQAHGLDVVSTQPGRRLVKLAGPTVAMEAAFGTRLGIFSEGTGEFRSYEGALQLPEDLAPIVESVLGLDSQEIAQPHFVADIAPAAITGHLPNAVAALYNFPPGLTGAGQCIGIIELGGGYHDSDTSTAFTAMGLAAPTVVSVSVDGAANSPGSDADGEVALDIQVAGAGAPQAKIAVYFAPNTLQGFADAITSAAHDTTNRPNVISISWGTAEANWAASGAQAMATMNTAMADAASLGISVFVASGDHLGTDNLANGKANVDFPASSPWAIGCGGTTIDTTGSTISSETVWNDGADGWGTGGGISDFFAVPSFQATTALPVSVNDGKQRRGVPDVSADAAQSSGYLIVLGGANGQFGGTSAVAPLWAGLTALLNQAAAPQTAGFFLPRLYGETNLVRAITTGNNKPSGSNLGYTAGAGWSGCTGLGVPIGTALLAGLVSPSQHGQLFHTIRNSDGSWQPSFGLVEAQESNNPGPFTAISCAGVGNEMELVGISGGQLWHTIRNPNGSWQPSFGLIESQEGNNPGPFTAIACAGVGNQMELVGIVGGQLWHTIRNADGSWQPSFGFVESQERNNPGAFTGIACAGVGNEMELVGIVGGQLWHTIRNADGSWQPRFGHVETQEANDPGPFTAISCAGVGNQMELVGIVGGQLWHTIRKPDGSWQRKFGHVETQETNNPGPFTAISCAGVGDQMELVGIVDGQLWHTIRNADGSWQPTFGLVESVENNNPGAFTAISVAGVGSQMELVGAV
jgi:kumamolisin